jgi:hypothetical protein
MSLLLCACGARSSLLSGLSGEGSSTIGDGSGSGSGGSGGNSGNGSGGNTPGPPTARTLSVSWSHSCAITSDAKVACWGWIGQSAPIASPTIVEGLDEVVEIAAGQILDCARRADGSVWCWGVATEGQLAKVEGATFSSVVTGAGTTCGVDGSGVACAGAPFLEGSSCGTDTLVWNPAAQAVPSLSGIAGIALGQWHACAFADGGATSCWGCAGGPAFGGQWALGSMVDNTATPIAVPGVSSTVRIAGETGSTCAVQADGSTLCWGDRSQFGTGIVNQPVGPTVADFPPFPLDLDVGVTFSCAAYENEVRCLGGIPTFEDGCMDRKDDPVSFSVPSITELSVGYLHACARDAGGAVWCWGCNGSGEVGDGTMTPRAVPVHVL